MIEPEESLRSRRTFIKSALAGAAGRLMADIDKHAAHAYAGAQEKRQGSNVSQLGLSEASQLVRSKKVSPVELTHECLNRIERLNSKLNAFITVTAESALAEARQAEAEIQHDGWRGPLHGIPIALKDLVDTAGVRTTAASGVFKDRVPTEDAEIVRRLKAAGAVFLGKLNLHEFAYGGSSAISYLGPVPNYVATIAAATSSLRLGIPRAYFYEALHPEIQAAMEAALLVLKELAGIQRDIAPLATNGSYSSVMDPYVAILRAEAYAYHKDYISKSPELYQAQTLKRIRAGADVTTSAYIQSRRQLEQVRRSVARAFETVDLLITPTACVPSFAIADLLADPNTLREKELLTLRNP